MRRRLKKKIENEYFEKFRAYTQFNKDVGANVGEKCWCKLNNIIKISFEMDRGCDKFSIICDVLWS